ncbi:MAG: hypothetical protein ACRDK9_12135 [Solirubrobacterales bacterium]
MRDPSEKASAAPATRAEVCDEIGRMVSSIWQRRSGVRPAGVSTEYVGDAVRCEIRQGESPPDVAGDETEDASIGSFDSRGYQHEAQAAVKRLTGRTVLAFIAKQGENGSAKNVFILERVLVKH